METNKYVVIQEWMLELGIKGNELIAYALIYGFCQDDRSIFMGTSAYVAKWLGVDRRRALDVLKRLSKKGLLEKKEEFDGGVKFCRYKTSYPMTKRHRGGDETSQGWCGNVIGGGDETSHNNNITYTKHKTNTYREETVVSDNSSSPKKYVSSSTPPPTPSPGRKESAAKQMMRVMQDDLGGDFYDKIYGRASHE